MRRLRLLSTLLLLLALMFGATLSLRADGERVPAESEDAKAPAPIVIESEHYRLTFVGEKSDAEEASKLLEAAWPKYEEFFGAAPKLKRDEKLNVFVDRTQEEMTARLRTIDVEHVDAGGIYIYKNKSVYAYRHPTISGSRAILLHECAHQFHFLSRMNNQHNATTWYIEGAAEFMGMHHWDGEKLEVGVIPLLNLKDHFAKVRARFAEESFSFDDFIEGKTPEGYTEWCVLTAWMVLGDKGKNRKRYEKMGRAIERGTTGKSSFLRNFGQTKKAFADLLEWLDENQQPWTPVFNEWQSHSANSLRGVASVVSFARLKEEVSELSATLIVPEGDHWRAGLLLSWQDNKNYTVAKIIDDKRTEMHALKDGQWIVSGSTTLKEAKTKGKRELKLTRDNESARFFVDGVEIEGWEFPKGTCGVAIDNCTADFVDLKWKPLPPKAKKD